MSGKFKIVVDEKFGYKRIDPIPSNKEIDDFYNKSYYEMIGDGEGNPDQIARLMSKSSEAESELSWLKNSMYSDILSVLKKLSPGKTVLDIGCGTGDLMLHMKDGGFDVSGIEPSTHASDIARGKGLVVENTTADRFKCKKKFDAVTMISVLEHVPRPQNVVEKVKGMLNDDGVLCIVVPNDFSKIQDDVKRSLDKKEDWWVSFPDHLNYFNFESLCGFLKKMGFDICYQQGDFPMELFLLMRQDYINDKTLGKKCHDMRVMFEKSLSPDLKRSMYGALSEVGIGRACLVVGRVR